MVALREAYEDRGSGLPAVHDAEKQLIAWEGGNHFFPVVDSAVRSSDLSSIARRATDESEAGGLSPFDGTEDMSLWDPFFGFVFRALSDGGVRYNRYHADNARYENWLRGQFRPDPGLGNPGASRSFAMARADRGPAVRKSHDARYAWWGDEQNEIQVVQTEELTEQDALDILLHGGLGHIPYVGVIPVRPDQEYLVIEPIAGMPPLAGAGKILVVIKASRFGQWVGRVLFGNQAARETALLVPRKASEIIRWAENQGWRRIQTASGPIKYIDGNGIVRVTIKRGSSRTPGSGAPHVELRNASGQRIDPAGNPVTRKSPGNHTPIEWDLN